VIGLNFGLEKVQKTHKNVVISGIKVIKKKEIHNFCII